MCCHFSCVQVFVTQWTVASQAPLFMGFSSQEYWSGFPCLPPGDLTNPGFEPSFFFFFFFCIAPGGSNGRESTCNVGDLGLIPGLGRSPGEGNSYPLQYSGLESSMDCIAQGVTKSRTRLSDFTISQKNFLEVELPGTSAFLKLLLPGATNLILMVQTQIFTTEDPLVSRTPP